MRLSVKLIWKLNNDFANGHNKIMYKASLIILLAISALLIIYLSWVPQPRIGLIWFIPDWVSHWADANENDTVRTGVPFFFIGIVIGIWLSRTNYSWYYWIISWLALVIFTLLVELGQIFLPNRRFDWKDVAWGASGSFAGLLIVTSIAYVFRQVLKR